MNIVHPCDSWSKSSGMESWNVALTAMNGGKVLTGSMHAISPGSKSTLGLTMFMDGVRAEGLHTFITEDGFVIVGHQVNFPSELLAAQKKQASELVARYTFLAV
jgi:hypothetical protein